MPLSNPLAAGKPSRHSPALQGLYPGAQYRPRGLFFGDRVHGVNVRPTPIKALPLIGGWHTPTVEGGGAYSLGGRTA